MLQKLQAKYDDFYTRPSSAWPKAPSRKNSEEIAKPKPSAVTYSGYTLPSDLDPLAIPSAGLDIGATSFQPSTKIIPADMSLIGKPTVPQTPEASIHQTPLMSTNTSQAFMLTTPDPTPFPKPTPTKIQPSEKTEFLELEQKEETPVEAKILSSTLSKLSLEEHGVGNKRSQLIAEGYTVGNKRSREEHRPPSRKRRSLDGSPSLSPSPFRPTAPSSDTFENALDEIRLMYCGQTIELCGLDLLMKSVYFPKIYKLFEAVFRRLQDYDVKRVEEGRRLLWRINRPLETSKWLLLRRKIQQLYSAIVDVIPADTDPKVAQQLKMSKQKVNIRDSEF